jgi:hypothetical protein
VSSRTSATLFIRTRGCRVNAVAEIGQGEVLRRSMAVVNAGSSVGRSPWLAEDAGHD